MQIYSRSIATTFRQRLHLDCCQGGVFGARCGRMHRLYQFVDVLLEEILWPGRREGSRGLVGHARDTDAAQVHVVAHAWGGREESDRFTHVHIIACVQ